jgi:hypothetical protein
MVSRRVLVNATATISAAKISQLWGICIASAPASNRVRVMGTGKPAMLKNTSAATISTNTGAGKLAAA